VHEMEYLLYIVFQKTRVMKNFSFKKFLFALFAITETTERGKRWKRVEVGTNARWMRVIKLAPGI
jgi:hypothetical protein